MNKNMIAVLLLGLAAGCSSTPQEEAPLPMDPTRKISEQECDKAIDTDGGNLKCHEVTEAERRARAAEEERQARAKKQAAERAERERLERERAEQLAREEAARKAAAAEAARLAAERAAEQERLAAERKRAEEEAARKAQEERERREKAEAEARARAQAEQEAREAAARECLRLEQERFDGRAMLENFVATYGQLDEYKGIAKQIRAFLAKPSKAKPCPPA
jgi:hypothetical protein